MLDADGLLTVKLQEGSSGVLGNSYDDDYGWKRFSGTIKQCVFQPGVRCGSGYGNALFRGCNKLESIDLTNLDTSSATDMFFMFSGCSSLESLDLSPLDTPPA